MKCPIKKNQTFDFLDKVQILVCKIIVWKPVNGGEYEAPPSDDKCLVLNECESIEIEDTYKKLINTAVIRFPKGTVVQRTIVPENEKSGVTASRQDNGAIVESRDGGGVATPSDFHVGYRIRVYLGYYVENWETANDFKKRQKAVNEALQDKIYFDGYIVQCSASSPIEIKCENLASILKTKMCTAVPPRDNVLVNDLFMSVSEDEMKKDKNKHNLLAGTGIKLYDQTIKSNINVGRIGIPEGYTVADLLSTWEDAHLYSFIKTGKNGEPCLAIGHTFYSGKVESSIAQWTEKENDAYGTPIFFDYDVAQDGLTLMNTDPQFLAVEAQSMTKDGKFYRITLTLNPEWNSKDPKSEQFRLINETNLSKKTMKLLGVVGDKVKHKVDLSRYNLVPYFSSVRGITKEKLIEEAKAFFKGYNFNGVEGSLTVFGDHFIRTGSRVSLVDPRNPEKNGIYFVDEVTTKFGVNGFRQVIHLPYCIVKFDNEEDKK